MKFRLRAGCHAEQSWREASPAEIEDHNIKKVSRAGKLCILERKQFIKGDTVTSDIDLEARFGSQKFQKITRDNSGVAATMSDDLEGKTLKQLQAYAVFHEIDITNAKSKAEALEMLKEAMAE